MYFMHTLPASRIMLMIFAREKICFDGALPSRKRGTRLSRLEKSRRKLELLRIKTQSGRQQLNGSDGKCEIPLENVLRSRALPARCNELPENPFIVPTVLEDLKYRWNKDNIFTMAREVLCVQSVECANFPWADITVMVPGEADAYCVHIAQDTGSSVLTNDSDLLLYDFGHKSSIIPLDSIELVGEDLSKPLECQVKALRLSPALIARRLGISDILRFAFELKTHPDAGMAELVQRANSAYKGSEDSLEYKVFIQEYKEDSHAFGTRNLQSLPHLDARVAELFWQYESRQIHMPPETPRMYLAILNEDHARRCAWDEGRLYRNLAYSIFNAFRPASERFPFIDEFVRRGGRIAVDKMALGDENWIMTQITFLCARLRSIKTEFGGNTTSPGYWIIFALCELYGRSSTSTFPDPARLSSFLTVGHMGKRFDWTDIHLTAQIQSVLYSIRILHQLLGLSNAVHDLMVELRSFLTGLPPLHIMMGSITTMMDISLYKPCINDVAKQIVQLVVEQHGIEVAESMETAKNLCSEPFATQGPCEPHLGNLKPLCKKTDNMYNILPVE
ncbi:hypothetical protein BBP40_012138 [Aspergillus hancockii]|nr:hypothetical protein BBP40_012138 [Aspergillus hancockii]